MRVSLRGTSRTACCGALLLMALSLLTAPPAGAQVCGNGTIEAGEDCDDGNTSAGDCCSPTCQFETGQGNPPCCALGVCQLSQACGGVCFASGGVCEQPGGPGTACACVAPFVCFEDADCDDGNPCTSDRCESPGTVVAVCRHSNLDGPSCTALEGHPEFGGSCMDGVCVPGVCSLCAPGTCTIWTSCPGCCSIPGECGFDCSLQCPAFCIPWGGSPWGLHCICL